MTQFCSMFQISALLVLLAFSSIECNMTSFCTEDQCTMSYLDIAIDMITKAKLNTHVCNNCDSGNSDNNLIERTVDCADILHMGYNESGVYKVRPMSRVTRDKFLQVYCDMETDGGGWTVIQRRGDFGRSHDFFFKDWKSYKEGFGDIEKDFWLGNDNIFALTNQKLYSARFDLKDIKQEKTYAVYDTFWIDDENQKYTLHISDYMGNAGDSMIAVHNNRKFSTQDQDNGGWRGKNCAADEKSAWWYNSSPPCQQAHLNGLYLKRKISDTRNYQGIYWKSLKDDSESLDESDLLEWTEIKIRPKIA